MKKFNVATEAWQQRWLAQGGEAVVTLMCKMAVPGG